jgi:hypothetical protein
MRGLSAHEGGRSTDRRCDNAASRQVLLQSTHDSASASRARRQRRERQETQRLASLSLWKALRVHENLGGQICSADIVSRLNIYWIGRNRMGVAGPTLPSFAVLGITDVNR